ncbi:MAG TPA: LysR family transcriptional regulator [Burkholderiaceae bacterium]|nr:LysR family transcriptional regulator [Burkholderiaceae bacterium]
MDYFNCLDAFVRVAEVGNFTEVARQLGVSRSVVSSRIQQLEEHVGVTLFHRSTRNVSLSQVGQSYYEECAQLLARANEIVEGMRNTRGSPSGILRIHGLPGLVLGHMASFLRDFTKKYPAIQFDFVVNDAVVDPVKEGFDCALQLFAPISDDLIQRRLFPVHRVFCATPAYLARHPAVQIPHDLERHALGLYSRYPNKDRWVFHSPDETVEVALTPSVKSNSIHFLKEIALEDMGIVCLPTFVCAKEIQSGQLTPLLTPYWLAPYWVSAVYPRTQRNLMLLRLFLDELLLAFTPTPVWDSALVSEGALVLPPDTDES